MKVGCGVKVGWLFLLLVIAATSLHAQYPTYLCELRNDRQPNARTYEFDIYLLSTGIKDFLFTNMQLGINLNAAARNDGIITVSFFGESSELGDMQKPTANKFSFTSTKNSINITAMRGPGLEYCTRISKKGYGTKVGTVRLTNSVDFGSVRPDLSWGWALADVNVITKVSAYVDGTIAEITVPASHTVCHLTNAELNPKAVSYEVTGSGSYCSGSNGLPVGITNSEVGVIYTLYKDSIPQMPTVAGTGLPLSFGNQTSGSYTVSGTYGTGFTMMTGKAVIKEIPAPAVPTGIMRQSFCMDTSPTTLNLTATGTGIQWYADEAGGNALPVSALSDNAHYFATQKVNGCESLGRFETVTSVFRTAPPAGDKIQSFCSGAAPKIAELKAQGEEILWYSSASGGKALEGSAALENNQHYYASQTLNNCPSGQRLDVTAVISTIPSPGGEAIQYFCQGEAPALIDLKASGTDIKWYETAEKGESLIISTSLVNGHHYFASQTVNGCESPRMEVSAVFNPSPSAPTGLSIQSFNPENPHTLMSLAAGGKAIQWYPAINERNPLSPSTILMDHRHYYATQTVNGCESSERLDVTAVVSTTPVASTDPTSKDSTLVISNPASEGLPVPVITRHDKVLKSDTESGNQWYLDGIPIPGATGNEYAVSSNGTYQVRIIKNGLISAPSNSISIEAELAGIDVFSVYPNPSNGLFNVKIVSEGEKMFDIEIYNIMGYLIWRKEKVLVKGPYIKEVNLSHSKAGVYLVIFKNSTVEAIRKVVIIP